MTRTLSTPAQAAKLIRKDLKEHFPNIKFTVTTDNYSMGDSITVEYTDGVAREKVESVINKYQKGNVNAMEDIYEYTNSQDFPQTKFLFIERSYSNEAINSTIEEFKNHDEVRVRDGIVKVEDASNHDMYSAAVFFLSKIDIVL